MERKLQLNSSPFFFGTIVWTLTLLWFRPRNKFTTCSNIQWLFINIDFFFWLHDINFDMTTFFKKKVKKCPGFITHTNGSFMLKSEKKFLLVYTFFYYIFIVFVHNILADDIIFKASLWLQAQILYRPFLFTAEAYILVN